MPVLFGPANNPRSCADPAVLYRSCREIGLDISWFGLANSFTNPRGLTPSEGYVLWSLLQPTDNIFNLDLQQLYAMTFRSTDAVSAITEEVNLYNLYCVNVKCITPGLPAGNPLTASWGVYLARISDARYFLSMRPVDSAYNLRNHTTKAYIPSTLKGGTTPWTWAEVAADLWARTVSHNTNSPFYGLGTWPGFPSGYTAVGTPDDLDFYGTDTQEALTRILGLLGLDLVFNPQEIIPNLQYTLCQAGTLDPDPTFEAARLALRPRICWDDAQPGDHASLPITGALVRFPKVPHARGDGSPYIQVGASSLTAGIIVEPSDLALTPIVYDDTPALMAQESPAFGPTNLAAILDRAKLVAGALVREIQGYRGMAERSVGQGKFRLIYAFALSDSRMMCGPQVTKVRWAETGEEDHPHRGLTTEIFRQGPARIGPPARRATDDPLVDMLTFDAAQPGGFLAATILKFKGVGVTPDPGESVWVSSLAPGVLGRLVGQFNGKKLYAASIPPRWVNPNGPGPFIIGDIGVGTDGSNTLFSVYTATGFKSVIIF